MGPEVLLTADTNAAAEARRMIRSVPGLPLRVYEDAGLLVSELVTNSVKHASSEPRDQIGLRVRREGRTLRVEVSDRSSERPTRREATAGNGGFGLNIVHALADRWGVDEIDDRQVTWFEMDI
jgi:two-component sensor histidine kinase